MDNILRDEVNQHTSDEVTKVLAELEAQGVDLTAIKEALAGGGSGMKVKSFQRGEVLYYNSGSSNYYVDVTIKAVDVTKSLPIANNMAKQTAGVLFDSNVVARLTSSNTLRLHGNYKRSSSDVSDRHIPWWVIEFE